MTSLSSTSSDFPRLQTTYRDNIQTRIIRQPQLAACNVRSILVDLTLHLLRVNNILMATYAKTPRMGLPPRDSTMRTPSGDSIL